MQCYPPLQQLHSDLGDFSKMDFVMSQRLLQLKVILTQRYPAIFQTFSL